MKSPSPYFKSYIHLFVCLLPFLSGPLNRKLPEEGTGSVLILLYLEYPADTQWTLNTHLMNNGYTATANCSSSVPLPAVTTLLTTHLCSALS